MIIGRNGDDGDHMEMEKCVLCPRFIRCLQLLFKEDLEWNGMKILQVLTQIPLLPNEYYTNTIAAKKNMRKVVLRDGFKNIFCCFPIFNVIIQHLGTNIQMLPKIGG